MQEPPFREATASRGCDADPPVAAGMTTSCSDEAGALIISGRDSRKRNPIPDLAVDALRSFLGMSSRSTATSSRSGMTNTPG